MSFARGIVILLAACVVAIVGYFVYLNYLFVYHPLVTSRSAYRNVTSIKVYPHSHLRRLANQFQQVGLWSKPHSFLWLARLHGFSGGLRYGQYKITPGMTAIDLLKNIKSSRGQVKHNVRIREGSTFNEFLAALKSDDNIRAGSKKISATLLKDPRLLALGAKSMEGLVYPDTYRFAWGVSDTTVVKYALKTMLKKLNTAWQSRSANLPIKTPYQALIVASLIQTEAGRLDERPKVAAVIYNRLRRGMRLQIDPTVMYGLGLPYGSVLVSSQMKKKTAYNTYVIEGLPPTPISLPTESSIDAAVHPSKIKALYFVAKGDGTHVFSNNYKQHKKAVSRYRALMNGRQWQREKEAVEAVVEEFL